VEGLLVFAKALSFAGSVGTKILASSTSQAPLSLKRSSGVRRGGRDSSSFAAAGWRQRMPGGDFEEGSSRNARALHSAPSASEGSRGQPRWQPEDGARKSPTLSAGPFQLAAEWPPLRRRLLRQRKRTTSPARGATIRCGRGYRRSRVCPYVESSLQKSVSGDGPHEAHIPNVLKGSGREQGPSPRMKILASYTRALRVPVLTRGSLAAPQTLRGRPGVTRSRSLET